MIYQPVPDVGMQGPESGDGHRMPGNPMQPSGRGPTLGDPVAVQGEHDAGPYFEANLGRTELNAQLLLPECPAPPVMVSPGHYDRDSASQFGQRGRHPKPGAGYHPLIGEPELEQIAIDQEAVPKVGRGFQEGKQALLGRRCCPSRDGRPRR